MTDDILLTLDNLYRTHENRIEQLLGSWRDEMPPFITTSVDLRHSGKRLVPVDTNLYPAGFNNLSARGVQRATRFMRRWLDDMHPQAKRLLIVPESHTRNLAYLDSLHVLSRICTQAGLEVVIGSLSASPGEPVTLTSLSGHTVTQQPLMRVGSKLLSDSGYEPDLILLNNDCTAGIPPQLVGVSQPIVPPPHMGWFQRRKSTHFAQYQKLAEQFAHAIGIDPWLINADFHHAGMIDFKERAGLDAVARAVDEVIEQARRKHAEYGIADDPYVYVKADGGTYGMGIMVVHSGSEMLELNKKERNKMQVIKEGARVSEVIIQEGIATVDAVKGDTAEPMIYLIDGVPVGGMYRINAGRDRFGNLNAAGMRFTGMCDEGEEIEECRQPVTDCHFHAYGMVAALAALAAGRERY